MPWAIDYKSQTRARIVAAAAAALRAKGVSGVSVADVMADAGLTHGGFYSHFSSKDDLLAEALEHANRQSLALLGASLDPASAEKGLHAIVDAYLSPWHVAHVNDGCPVAAVGPEVARAGGKMRRDLGRFIWERLDWLSGLISGGRRTRAQEEQVVGTLACMVGGLILARAVSEKDSAALLDSCRGFLRRALDDLPDASDGPKPTARRLKKTTVRRRTQPTRKPRT